MTTSNKTPVVIPQPIAAQATSENINAIPNGATGTNRASFQEGFPAITRMPVIENPLPTQVSGLPPKQQDFNGLFNVVSQHNFFAQNGGTYSFNQAVSDAIGGYPKNAVLWYFPENETPCLVRSLINDNTNNFVNDPTLIDGIHWEMLVNPSSYANIALANSPYTTNRILEIPQNIHLELNNGTLTLKAGSKVYVPNGFEADGTTPKFDMAVSEEDISSNSSWTSGQVILIPQKGLTYGMYSSQISNNYSGSTEPATKIDGTIWYDTANNLIKRYSTSNSEWESGLPFPICISTMTSGVGFTSIDQVFNGFGYIGSTVFALPGVKCQSSTGRNADGTCTNLVHTLSSVLTYEAGPWNNATLYFLLWSNTCEGQDVRRFTRNKEFSSQPATYSFDENENKWYYSNNNQTWNDSGMVLNIVGKFVVSSGKITSFEPYSVDSIVNSNEFYQLKDKAVTTDTTQTITASKNMSLGGTAAYARPIQIMMPTSTESNPTEIKSREIAFVASEGAGERYEGSLTHVRSTIGESYTGLRAGRLINGTFKEGALGVRITADGTTFGTAPSTPANPANNIIVTADYVRKFLTPTGTIIVWSTSTPPDGYLICNGAAISRTTYAALFNVIGTTWGAGDGKTTFNLPNLYLLSDIKVRGYTALGLTTYSAPNVPTSQIGNIYRSDEPAGASGPFVMFNQNVQNQGIGLTSDVNSTGLAYNKTTFQTKFCIRY